MGCRRSGHTARDRIRPGKQLASTAPFVLLAAPARAGLVSSDLFHVAHFPVAHFPVVTHPARLPASCLGSGARTPAARCPVCLAAKHEVARAARKRKPMVRQPQARRGVHPACGRPGQARARAERRRWPIRHRSMYTPEQASPRPVIPPGPWLIRLHPRPDGRLRARGGVRATDNAFLLIAIAADEVHNNQVVADRM